MKTKTFYLFLWILLVSGNCPGQNIFTAFQSEEKRANQYLEEKSYFAAFEIFKKIAVLNNDKEAYLKSAQCLKALNRLPEAEDYYRNAMEEGGVISKRDHLDYAESLMSNGKYQLAKKEFEAVVDKFEGDTVIAKRVSALSSLKQFYEDSLSYQLKPLPVNSQEAEFCPVFFKGGLLFLSSRRMTTLIKNTDAATNSSFYDFYYSKKEDGNYSDPVKAELLNNMYHAGPLTFFENGNKVIFTRNDVHESQDGISHHALKHLMLYSAEKDSSGRFHHNIKPLPFNNPSYSVSHCSYSEETKTLYFVSDMSGGYGGTDIYKSKFNNGEWSVPENMGPHINTFGNEMFPFIYEGKVLCFSSNGHPGLGGLDNFYLVLDSTHFHVQNVGYPLNSKEDDFGIIIGDRGSYGYFCSNRTKNDDIYEFSLNKILLHGQVLDKMGEKKMSNVVVKVFEEGKKIAEYISDDQANYNFALKPGKTYLLNIIKDGYKENKTTLTTPSSSSSVVYIDKNIIMERRNKSFVKGFVRDTFGMPIPGCTVKVINSYGKDQNIKTDKNGIFKCEVDSDVENLFIAEIERLWGTQVLEPENRSKGSLVLNVEIEVNPVRTYDITGYLKDEKTEKPLEGFEVVVSNFLTGEKKVLCTAEDGKFNFKAVSHITYDVIIQFGKRKTHLKSFAPKQDYNFEIFWADK